MQQHIAVGVSAESIVVGNTDAPDDHVIALFKRMDIKPLPNSNHAPLSSF